MDPIATYVFLDLGAIGLPEDKCTPQIISLSLLAVSSKDLRNIQEDTRQAKISEPPVIRRKYCHNKNGTIDLEAELREFMNNLEKPVCLITYCGFYYDFPILKKCLSCTGTQFFEEMACADAMAGFYDILWPKGEKTSRAARLEGEFPWPKMCGLGSFKLEAVYHRVLQDTEYYASGGDEYKDEVAFRNMAVIRIAVKLAEEFIPWLEKNCYKFSEVPLKPREKFVFKPRPMEIKREIQ
ncbi:uncharacterized protein LOC134750863 [Cydia strobilella]|uniref:uncharacterized protein LOC134750863 n=1 Tax=Cydia strobilella TaxID=1100964 RepID=UPI003004B0B7